MGVRNAGTDVGRSRRIPNCHFDRSTERRDGERRNLLFPPSRHNFLLRSGSKKIWGGLSSHDGRAEQGQPPPSTKRIDKGAYSEGTRRMQMNQPLAGIECKFDPSKFVLLWTEMRVIQ